MNYAPTSIQADVNNMTVNWDSENLDNVVIKKSLFTLVAVEEELEFTVTYNYGNSTNSKTLSYNSLLQLNEVPKEYGGQKFAYWTNEKGEIISPYSAYNMRVIRNEVITAVYSNSPGNIWNALIDEASVSREISDESDIVYTDYTAHFANSLAKTLPESMVDENIVDFGIIVVQNKESYSGKGECSYPSSVWTSDQQQTIVKTVASGSADIRNLGGYICTRISYSTNSQVYKLPELTKPFNRCAVAMTYDNTDQKAEGYNFSTYTYIRFSDGTYKISDPSNVNLYAQAHDSDKD